MSIPPPTPIDPCVVADPCGYGERNKPARVAPIVSPILEIEGVSNRVSSFYGYAGLISMFMLLMYIVFVDGQNLRQDNELAVLRKAVEQHLIPVREQEETQQ